MSITDGNGARRSRFLTVPEVARELGISERSVWRLIEMGELSPHRFGAATRIKREELDAYVERSRSRAPRPRDHEPADGSDDNPRDEPLGPR
jgi:excisionase family DNA binding protein